MMRWIIFYHHKNYGKVFKQWKAKQRFGAFGHVPPPSSSWSYVCDAFESVKMWNKSSGRCYHS